MKNATLYSGLLKNSIMR